ncbi:hypothetical protein AAG570_008229 [Ranatra chinensis]|uniref:Kelch domain-containing protein 10 n=1 Tax=Ranatra chinensis TaxID=642074 RepID=A0ABD0XSJ3_9HEMI
MGIHGSTEGSSPSSPRGIHYKFKPFKFELCNPTQGLTKPTARSGHRVVCTESDLYTYGGYNPSVNENDPDIMDDPDWFQSRPLFKEVWRYNMAARWWAKVPVSNIPTVLASNAVVLSGSVLLVYGGTGVPFGGHCSNALYVCDLVPWTPSFRLVEVSGSSPDPQYGQAVLLLGKYLYVIGGTTGYEYSSDVHRLDLETSVWECVYLCNGGCDEPMGRYRHELGFDGKRIFVLGGGTAELVFGFEDLSAFDVETKQWLKLWTIRDATAPDPGYPEARRFHSCVQMPGTNNVVIIGGFTGVDILDDCWMLDLIKLRWKKLTDLKLPYPAYFHSSSVTPAGKLYNFGGINQKGKSTERTSDIHSAWICIPKLKEICWEAVQFYKFTSHLTMTELRNHGCPEEFMQRIPQLQYFYD